MVRVGNCGQARPAPSAVAVRQQSIQFAQLIILLLLPARSVAPIVADYRVELTAISVTFDAVDNDGLKADGKKFNLTAIPNEIPNQYHQRKHETSFIHHQLIFGLRFHLSMPMPWQKSTQKGKH